MGRDASGCGRSVTHSCRQPLFRAIAQFIKATELGDESERDAIVAEVLKYNEEDLDATWAVFQWLQSLK